MRIILLAAIAVYAGPAALADCGTYEQQLAHNHVKQRVKMHLDSPRSAKFPFAPTKKVLEQEGSTCVVILSAWVDSKNAFNVKIRNSYVAEVKIRGKRVEITQFGFTE